MTGLKGPYQVPLRSATNCKGDPMTRTIRTKQQFINNQIDLSREVRDGTPEEGGEVSVVDHEAQTNHAHEATTLVNSISQGVTGDRSSKSDVAAAQCLNPRGSRNRGQRDPRSNNVSNLPSEISNLSFAGIGQYVVDTLARTV
jgi:hypothetical protein